MKKRIPSTVSMPVHTAAWRIFHEPYTIRYPVAFTLSEELIASGLAPSAMYGTQRDISDALKESIVGTVLPRTMVEIALAGYSFDVINRKDTYPLYEMFRQHLQDVVDCAKRVNGALPPEKEIRTIDKLACILYPHATEFMQSEDTPTNDFQRLTMASAATRGISVDVNGVRTNGPKSYNYKSPLDDLPIRIRSRYRGS